MMSVKLSDKIKNIKRRVAKLPKVLEMKMDAMRKRDAYGFVRIFQEGIRDDSFGLNPLSEPTIQQKADKGYERPSTPLYGAGDSEANSLINVFQVRKIKNGWRVSPRKAKHHESDLPLDALLSIHENGCIILVTDKMRAFLHYIGIHLRADTYAIRIPPRPAKRMAYERLLQEIAKRDPVKEIKRAVRDLINEGREEPPTYGLKEI